MSERTGYTYWVCQDCYFVHHYGDEAENIEVADPLSLIPDDAEVTAGLLADAHAYGCDALETGTECECETQTFSRWRCDGCGTGLAGTRHALTVWERQMVG